MISVNNAPQPSVLLCLILVMSFLTLNEILFQETVHSLFFLNCDIKLCMLKNVSILKVLFSRSASTSPKYNNHFLVVDCFGTNTTASFLFADKKKKTSNSSSTLSFLGSVCFHLCIHPGMSSFNEIDSVFLFT